MALWDVTPHDTTQYNCCCTQADLNSSAESFRHSETICKTCNNIPIHEKGH